MFGLCFVIHYLVSFLVFQLSPPEKERIGSCFTLIAFLLCLTVSVLCLFLTVPWVGLWSVIVGISWSYSMQKLSTFLEQSINCVYMVSSNLKFSRLFFCVSCLPYMCQADISLTWRLPAMIEPGCSATD